MAKRQQIVNEANYIVENGATVRMAAANFGISKSTIHIHMTKELPDMDIVLYESVRKVMEKNKAERHLRGGVATKMKYEAIKKENT